MNVGTCDPREACDARELLERDERGMFTTRTKNPVTSKGLLNRIEFCSLALERTVGGLFFATGSFARE